MGVEFRILFPDKPTLETQQQPPQVVVQAGESLQGFVVLIVTDDKGVKASALDVTFYGKEQTEVRYTKREGTGKDSRTVTKTAYSHRRILESKLPMASLASTIFETAQNDGEEEDEEDAMQESNTGKKNKIRIPPGKYLIPFALELPESIPGSFCYDDPSDGKCEIRYYFKVILKGSGRMWNYNTEETVHVKSRKQTRNSADKQQDTIPYDAPPVNETIRSCYFPMGSISLGARLDDTQVHKGQECRVNVSCRNHSAAEIDSVRATLRQEFKWKAGSHRARGMQSILSMDFTQPLLLQGSLATQSKALRQTQDISSELREMFREVNKAKNSATFTIPREYGESAMSNNNKAVRMLCTYSSGLITISHRLELEVLTSGCCVTNPSLLIPMLVEEEPANTDAAHVEAEVEVAPSGQASYVPPQYEDAIQAPVIYVPSSHVTMGGTKVDGAAEDPDIEVDVQVPSDFEAQPPSLNILLKEMSESVADWDIIQRKLQDPDWDTIFATLTPNHYALILQQVALDFDQPKIAVCLAQTLQQQGTDSSGFTCAHVVAALNVASEWNRATVVEKNISYCSDLVTNQDQILSQLTDWEKLVTERAFAKALDEN